MTSRLSPHTLEPLVRALAHTVQRRLEAVSAAERYSDLVARAPRAVRGPRVRKKAAVGLREKQAIKRAIWEWLSSPKSLTSEERSFLARCLRDVGGPAPKRSADDAFAIRDPLLSTSEAAALLGCSRPHVAMLVDSGRLAGERTAGGHRRVRRSELEKYKASLRTSEATHHRTAAQDAGMYALDDATYEALLREAQEDQERSHTRRRHTRKS